MGDIFNEVDEEVRQEQVSRLWNRYGRYFLASLAIIVLGTAGHAAWDYFGTQRSLADGGRFSNAIELFQLEQHQEASKLFSELTADAGHGYGQLAQLQKAAVLLDTNDHDGAISLYDELANNAGAGDIIGQLANVLAAIHEINNNRAAEADKRLLDISEGEGPWRHLALELRALALLKIGNMNDARQIFLTLIGDPASPPGVRSRASQIAGTLYQNPE